MESVEPFLERTGSVTKVLGLDDSDWTSTRWKRGVQR
jgi:hypothetical protein